MATNFPTSLDTLANPTSGDNLDTVGVTHTDQHSDANDAIEALQAKVGIDASAVATTLDYLLKSASSVAPGHKHKASDFPAVALASLPAASSAGAGAMYRITDLAGGSPLVWSDGTYWRPWNGLMLLESGAGTSHTGNSNETTLKTVTVPAKLMTPNAFLAVISLFEMTNNGNNKRMRIRFSGAAGTAFMDQTIASFANTQVLTLIRNNNATNAQLSAPITSTGFGTSGNAIVTGTVDTAASDTTLVSTVLLSNTGDTVTLRHQLVLLGSF